MATNVSNMVCPLCPSTRLQFNVTEYLCHVKLFHSHQPNFLITCGIGGCLRTFKNIGTLRNHVSARHSEYLYLADFNSQDDDTEDEGEDITDADNSNPAADDNATPVDDTSLALKKYAGLFLLGLKEKQKLTQVSLIKVIEGVTTLFQRQLDTLHTQVNSKLEEAGVDIATISGLSELFEQENVRQPFFGLETLHRQTKFYKENFVVSILLLSLLL